MGLLQKCNLSELPKGELAILQLISNRLCVAVGDPHRYAETVIELDCGGTVFSTKGKTVVQDGWKALVQKNDSTKSDENVQTLPSVSVGDEMTVSGTEMPALRQCCRGQSQGIFLFQQSLQICPLEKQSLLCEHRQEHDFCHGAEIAWFRQGKAQELQVRKNGQHL